jgi:chromosomal replication initiation ATPase DnaA
VEKEQNIIDSTVTDFLLNSEQERAFRIIANHASTEKPEQLIMYIGGMAGTGKSQVIKAPTASFKRWNESRCIVITSSYWYNSCIGWSIHISFNSGY